MENVEIKQILQEKHKAITNLSYRNFLIGVAEYMNLIISSPLWLHLQEKVKKEKQRDEENYNAMKNKHEGINWRLSPSLWLAWEKSCVIYDIVYKGQKDIHLEPEVNDIGLRTYIQAVLSNQTLQYWERERDTRETFEQVHTFIMDEMFLLQQTTEDIKQSTTSGWLDKKNGKYQFDKKIFQQKGRIRGNIFQVLMDTFEKSPQGVSIQGIAQKTHLKPERIRIEIAAINTRLSKQIGLQFKGTGKGYYILEKFSASRNNNSNN